MARPAWGAVEVPVISAYDFETLGPILDAWAERRPTMDEEWKNIARIWSSRYTRFALRCRGNRQCCTNLRAQYARAASDATALLQ